MARPSAAKSAEVSKRKAKPHASTLTPAQLARKRANDREAQRAIRARTKERIDRLEREVKELKCGRSRDQTVQELLRRNQALEEELMRLKENMGVSMTSSLYSTPDTALSTSILSTPTSLSPQSSTLVSPSVYTDDLRKCRSGNANPHGFPFLSNEEYNASYDTAQDPNSLLPLKNTDCYSINVGHGDKDVIKMEYEDVDSHGTVRP
ncbi:hypothetical protein FMUND_88 [Fusarium mundagurra]|uniref:BZIP domain-containing protein n=1 Tax=Fusarium mundagurra TaxID=1567541 RepID=A0A8H5Z5G7_9HYPO|nr:hypothetical protein FMUND_88 [Fusarium mundagurra]